MLLESNSSTAKRKHSFHAYGHNNPDFSRENSPVLTAAWQVQIKPQLILCLSDRCFLIQIAVMGHRILSSKNIAYGTVLEIFFQENFEENIGQYRVGIQSPTIPTSAEVYSLTIQAGFSFISVLLTSFSIFSYLQMFQTRFCSDFENR